MNRWFRQNLSLLTPEEQSEADIEDAIISLHRRLLGAQQDGHQFLPRAQQARTALKAIHWL